MTDIYAVPPGTMLDAALDYISRGWCIFPVAGQRGGDAGARWKAPYGVGRWSIESSRDEAKIRAWWEGNDDIGIGLDMGKSGLVALDGDQHDLLVEWAGIENLTKAPSWRGHPLRRSYLFQQPMDGDPIGCPVREWGEIRGVGGYMVIPPSPHPIGGRYVWLTLADPEPLPEVLAEMLRVTLDGQPSSSLVPDATNEQVIEFIARHTARSKPVFLDNIMVKYHAEIDAGAGRYPTLRDHLCWALEEAATGVFSAREAVDLLGAAYKADLAKPQARPFDKSEWDRVLRWAVGRALLKNPAERAERLSTSEAPVTLLDMDGYVYEQSELPIEDLEFRREVDKRVRSLMVDKQAKDEMRAGEYVPMLEPVTLAQLAEMNFDEVKWRVGNPVDFATVGEMDGGGLLTTGGSVVISGAHKSGKTSLMVDLVACLADGGDFLGRFPVTPPAGRICLMDYESHGKQILKWYGQREIRAIDRFVVMPLRGMPNPYSTPEGRADLIKFWRKYEVEVLIVDPLSVLLADLREDENDNHATRKGLDELRRVAHTAGVQEIIVVAHAGKTAELGSRGASSIEDWPDAIWRLRAEGEGGGAERTFSAFGRDVDLAPSTLEWDHDRRRPTLRAIGDVTEQKKEHEEEAKALSLRSDVVHWFRKKWMGDTGPEEVRGIHTSQEMRAALALSDAKKGLEKSRVSSDSKARDLCTSLVADGMLELVAPNKYRYLPASEAEATEDDDEQGD